VAERQYLHYSPLVKIMEFNADTLEKVDKSRKKRDELRGKVLTLKDLVDYQDGTVASRMIVNTKAGSITLFSFDEDEGLSEHTAPFDAVVTILDGECEVWVQGVTYQMKEGDTIIFPAGIPHALSAVTRFKMSLTMIRENES
jgi:quercetin dioxygenase-like cupin family protein